MSQRIASLMTAAALSLGATCVAAKIPPPPPMDPAAKAAADEKKAKAAAAAKADLMAAEERAIKNYQENMRKMGKPLPKPVAVAEQSAPPKGGMPAPQSNTQQATAKSQAEAAKAAQKAAGKK